MKKAIFFDIDGTLVSHKANPSYIPEPTREAVRMLKKAGHMVAFATGRGQATVRLLMEELGIANAVLSYGSHIRLNGATTQLICLARETVKLAMRHVKEKNCQAYVSDENFIYTFNVPEESLSYLRDQAGPDYIKDIHDMGDACKIEYFGGSRPKEITGDMANTKEAYGGVLMLPPGVCKEQGIRRLAELAGFSMMDTIAVGDDVHDIGMLKAAGLGIAVGGAPEAVKAAAAHVTGAIEDGGIFHVFRRLGLI